MQQFPLWLLILSFALYVALMFFISYLTSRKMGANSFFSGDRKAPWFVVAYGMVGTSISGVTFVSVPGNVMSQNFYYMPLVFGFVGGYILIAKILLPLYYRMNLTSIYTYLGERFGMNSYKTGTSVFMVSRILGAAVRIYVVALVLYAFIPKSPEWQTHSIADILLFSVVAFVFLVILYFYTYKGGVKTIIWTDVLQTTFMLLAVFLSIYFICKEMNWGLRDMVAAVAGGENANIAGTKFSSLFDWEWSSGTNAVKQFIAGIFMTVAMTGLDQGMIQKSLACKDIKSAQKNMYSTSVITVCANYFFLLLGALLCMYLQQLGGMAAIGAEKTDEIFPTIASQYLGIGVGIFFLIGLISASYPSAGNALTSLTTSYCIDFARFSTRTDMDDNMKTRFKNKIHALFAVIFFVIMVILYIVSSDAVVNLVYKLASYTYGPLLGMFFFGIFTKYKVKDKASPYIAVAAPVLCFIINSLCKALFNFELGFTLLIVNGVLTFLGLYLFRNGKMVENTNN